MQVLPLLNNQGPIPLRDLLSFMKGEKGWGEHRLDDLVPHLPQTKSTHERRDVEQAPLSADKGEDEPQVPGYTTHDDAGSDGDDTVHQAITFYSVPNCVASNIGFDASDDGSKPETLDLVYNEFIQDWVLLALRYLGINYGAENTRTALEGTTFTDVISNWVEENWECKD